MQVIFYFVLKDPLSGFPASVTVADMVYILRLHLV